jgi:SNF2 family DNA or RNA helicase
MPLVIARLDKLSRSDELQAKLLQTEWDLVVCDEAHKMSASFFGGEVKETKRYKLGKLLSGITRNFLLMSATPHNGKEEDFQLFMALLDADRFEGRFRDGVHTAETADLMRRLVKEDLLKFDGTHLFPERKAYTVGYQLSDLEQSLYQKVTDYVREEFNRADALENNGRKGTVGFALTILQRRLASSPEAIYRSLCRRRERLQQRLQDEQSQRSGAYLSDLGQMIDPDDWDDDFEDSDIAIVCYGDADVDELPATGANELFALAGAVMLGASMVLRVNEHVRVDVFYGQLSARIKVMVDLFGFHLNIKVMLDLKLNLVEHLVVWMTNTIKLGLHMN